MVHNQKQAEEIREKEDELRKLLRDPDILNEIMKDAYIPVGRSTVDMLDDVLQTADMDGDSKNEL